LRALLASIYNTFPAEKLRKILKLGFAWLPALVAQALQKIFNEGLHKN